MNPRPRTLPLSVLVLLVVYGLSAPATVATTLIQLDVGQMADRAELIFVGTAVGQESVATADASYAYTFVTFEVQDVLKGATEDKQLVLRFDGGDIDDEYVLKVAGIPRFIKGQTYLLFVADNERSASPLVGWTQGQLGLLTDPETGVQTWIDRTGSTVLGIEGGDWRRAERLDEHELLVEVVASDGVEIVGGPVVGLVEAPRKQATVESAVVLEDLKRFVDSRSVLKSHRSGDLVLSASPLNIPSTRRFDGVSAEEGR